MVENLGPLEKEKVITLFIVMSFRLRRSERTLGSGYVRVDWMTRSCSRVVSVIESTYVKVSH